MREPSIFSIVSFEPFVHGTHRECNGNKHTHKDMRFVQIRENEMETLVKVQQNLFHGRVALCVIYVESD